MPKSFLLALVLLISRAAFAQTPNNARMLSTPNTVTSTPYTFVGADTTRVVVFNSASAIAASLPNGASQGFGAGTMLSVVNLGAGQVTITCSSCTINGVATLVLAQNQGADIYGGSGSPAVNYAALQSPAGANIAMLNAANTWSALNNFNGGLQSNGVNVVTNPVNLASQVTGVLPGANMAATNLAGGNNPGGVAGTLPGSSMAVFVASGASHAPGAVPDPGASAGTTHFLREDATWATVPASGVSEATYNSCGATTTSTPGLEFGCKIFLANSHTRKFQLAGAVAARFRLWKHRRRINNRIKASPPCGRN